MSCVGIVLLLRLFLSPHLLRTQATQLMQNVPLFGNKLHVQLSRMAHVALPPAGSAEVVPVPLSRVFLPYVCFVFVFYSSFSDVRGVDSGV